MGTNCTISVEVDGKLKTIYCHFDGYLEGVGKMLYENYDRAKAVELVNGGNVSYVAKNVNPTTHTHSFSTPEEDVCVFYHRDNGELWHVNKPVISDIGTDDAITGQYNYLLRDDGWYVNKQLRRNVWTKVSFY